MNKCYVVEVYATGFDQELVTEELFEEEKNAVWSAKDWDNDGYYAVVFDPNGERIY